MAQSGEEEQPQVEGFNRELPSSQMPSALFRRGVDPFEYHMSEMEQERQER